MDNALMLRGATVDGCLRQIELIKDGYTYQIRDFLRWARSTGHGLDEAGIREYFQHMGTLNLCANTIRNRRAAIKRRVRQVFHDAPLDDRMKIDRVLSDLDHDDPAPKINSVQVTRDKVIDPTEYRAMVKACRSDRQRAFVQFLYATGCRVSEMIGVRLDRCEVSGDSVKVRILGKGRKERFVRIPAELFDFMRATFSGSTYLCETSTGHQYTREYVSSQVSRVGALIGRDIAAHSLRHSFVTRKVQQFPGKLDAISRYVGHSSPSITLAMYCHSSMSDSELFDDLDMDAML